MPFDGETYDPALDQERLTKQLGRVYESLSAGQWRTLAEIKNACNGFADVPFADSEAGISARIRDLRKDKFGGYTVERRRRAGGLWEYRLFAANQAKPGQMTLFDDPPRRTWE